MLSKDEDTVLLISCKCPSAGLTKIVGTIRTERFETEFETEFETGDVSFWNSSWSSTEIHDA